MSKLEECIFCESNLENYEYGRTVDNGERAESKRLPWHSMSICKNCAYKLKILIEDAKCEVEDA